MSIFTSFSVGVSGLKSSQNAINTTSHNLANVNTPGYVRQQAVMADTHYLNIGTKGSYINQVGIGVDLEEVRRIRDTLLDKAFRQESGRQEFYEAQKMAIDEVEELFGELEGVAFQDYLEELEGAIQEIVKDPNSQVTRSSLIESAVSFITRANAIYDGLVEYQNTLNKEIQNMVAEINSLGEKIHTLNQKISAIESVGIENANDLRDERDVALDRLAELAKISYEEDLDGVVEVKVEGVVFVNRVDVNYMECKKMDADKGSVLVTPVWPFLADKEVYNLNQPSTTKKNTDIGALKGLLLARGDSTANYTDIPNAADYPGGKTDQAYLDDLETYRVDIEQSTIKTVMAEFDQLINAMVTEMNDIFSPNMSAADMAEKLNYADANALIAAIKAQPQYQNGYEYPKGSGFKYEITADTKFFNAEEAGYGYGDNREVQGTELFSRNYTDRYVEIELNGEKLYILNEHNEFGNESLYTLGNLSVNEAVLQDYTLIPLSLKDGGEDRARAEKLGQVWDEAALKLTPDYNTQKSYMEYYNEFTGQIANAGKLYTNMIEYQEELATGIDDERQRIMGVSSDEELTNLIKYQAAYNASSRYINVINEMLEHLITRL